jgi:Acetyltransferase (GNAT) domain
MGAPPLEAMRLHAKFIAPDFWHAYVAAGGSHDDAPSPHPIGYVDLTLDEHARRRHLRKSYRSLINWGKRNLVVGTGSIDLIRAFHAKIAGRETRPQSSWNVQEEWIADSGGEALVGFLGPDLVSAAIFIDGDDASIYWTGVYDRERFEHPLAHYLMWLGIERAKERGMTKLILGEIPERGTVPDKEYQIGYFKRGFATNVVGNWIHG